ncbi:hypothetical protein NC653_012495 [Populus alba x Populus x berolinensis]|uniref:Uncharacterized protein n=1 Tax=Populus alba x Populus x berolinensis TaxID=444605 RepID=A0AAD6QSN2_9ROSI|nr:hypothetical protein NC653_012495 [Populus alba x Populus x berolinensis]
MSLHFPNHNHDVLHKTWYIIVKGVAGTGAPPTTSPIGTSYAYQDFLTITSNPSSEVVSTSGAA